MSSKVKLVGYFDGEYVAGVAFKERVKQYLKDWNLKREFKGWKSWVEAFNAIPITDKQLLVLREKKGIKKKDSRYLAILGWFGGRSQRRRQSRLRISVRTNPLIPRPSPPRPTWAVQPPAPPQTPASSIAQTTADFIRRQDEVLRSLYGNQPATSGSAGNGLGESRGGERPNQPVRHTSRLQSDDWDFS